MRTMGRHFRVALLSALALLPALAPAALPAPADERPDAGQPAADQPAAGQPAQTPECRHHQLDAAEAKEKLRHWRGLAAFSHWRLLEVRPAACVLDGKVESRLVLAPPKGWSSHRIGYKVQTQLSLDPESATPVGAVNGKFGVLARGVRRLVHQVEANEDVRRFIERFPPDQAMIEPAGDPGKLKVAFVFSPSKDGGRGRPVKLVYSEAFNDGQISAYDLPRIDSLPVRRELLSFAAELSARSPHCLAGGVRARFESPPGGDGDRPGRWWITARLTGDNCPKKFGLALEHDSANDRWLPIDSSQKNGHAEK